MLDFLSKTAGILNNVDSPAAKQAAAALEGVLKAHAARRTSVMTPEEVAEFNAKLKDFLDSTLNSGKIPRGLKWRLLQLKDGHVQLNRQLARLEKQTAQGETPMVPAEPPGDTTPVQMPGEADSGERSWGDIVDEAERERQEMLAKQKVAPAPIMGLDRPAPVEGLNVPAPIEGLTPLAKRRPEVVEDATSLMQGDVAGDMVSRQVVEPSAPAEPASPLVRKKQPPMKVLTPESVSEMVDNPQSPPSKYAPKGTSAEKAAPVGTHAETWDEKLRRWMGMESRSELIRDMIKVADKLDSEGYTDAADILEQVVTAAADQYPSLNETRKDLYDFKAHNQETMHEVAKREVEENRKNHHLQTHQGMAVSQTRYSPDMPGVMMTRISDGVYQDTVTNKIYDFQHGFTDASGNPRAGGSIKHQTPNFSQYAPPSRIFEGAGALSRKK